MAYDSKKGNDDGDDDEEEDRIIGGERVTPNRYPWIAELVLFKTNFSLAFSFVALLSAALLCDINQ